MPSLGQQHEPPPKPVSPGAVAIKKFRSAGDVGDLVYQMAAVKAICGPSGKAVIYLEAANYTRIRLSKNNWRGIDRVLKAQNYIADVLEWNPTIQCEMNCNDFRSLMQRSLRQNQGRDVHLADWVALAHRLPTTTKDTQWITIEPVKIARVVINRAGPGRPPQNQYYNPEFPWRKVLERYGKDAIFIGTELEHQVFSSVHGEIPYYKTPSLYEAAQVISGADLVVGNQSCCVALAESMKKRIVLEVWMAGQNSSVIDPPRVTLGYNSQVELPEL